jgi:glycosyltransferase involved in cell wall biosynthesis
MRIAIDARTLSSPKTGDRTVTLGLARGLTRLAEQERLELILIGQEPPPDGLLPDSPAISQHLAPRPRGYRWMLSAFPRALAAVKADVAVIQYMGPFRAPCPFVTFIHDTVWRTMPGTFPWRDALILNTFIPGTIRRAAAVLTGSDFARSEIARHYPAARDKLHIVPYAADERFQPVMDPVELARVQQAHKLPERFILSVGVLQPRKNIEGLLEAYALLSPELRSQYQLVITGKTGWMADRLRVAASETEGVDFTGYVPDEDLPALYSLADLFVYPSFYEGFGLPPLEAMACGTPVIASNAASLPEVVDDAALLVDPHQPRDLAAAMTQVLTDDARGEDLITRGLARAAQFDWTASAQQLLKTLRAVATSPP